MKINWKEQFVSLIVVILGITIAFWVNRWGENNRAEQLEKQYIQSFVKDMEDDTEKIDYLIGYSDRQLASVDRIVGVITGTHSPSDSLTSDIFNIQFNLPFISQDVTYQSLTGNVEIINDFEMRTQIIKYYSQNCVSMKLWDDSCKETIDNFIKPVTFRNLTYVSPNQIDIAIFESMEIRNAIFAMRYLYQERLNYLKSFKAEAERLINSLKGYQDSFK